MESSRQTIGAKFLQHGLGFVVSILLAEPCCEFLKSFLVADLRFVAKQIAGLRYIGIAVAYIAGAVFVCDERLDARVE
jgi:hypothetical protein